MNGLGLIKKMAAVGVLALGIIVMWQAEERSLKSGSAVMVNAKEYPAITDVTKVTTGAETGGKKGKKKEQANIPQIEQFVDMNKDVIGYISIPETNVNYPVLLGEDNAYYLNHNIYGNTEKAGCIMADYKYGDTKIREEFERHTLLYGHYLTTKTMFTSVAKYKNEEFFKSHPYIYFSNLKETGKWKVFSVYVLDADKETLERKFEQDEEYIQYLNKIKERSWYPVDVELTKDSKVLTLCTCSYETHNSRAIVHAVLVDE